MSIETKVTIGIVLLAGVLVFGLYRINSRCSTSGGVLVTINTGRGVTPLCVEEGKGLINMYK